jgi:HEXXH motif-containing protein
VAASPAGLRTRIETALGVIQQAWPDGAGLLAGLTTRIVPLRARGVVSFSYRHRPGLSFINVFDRSRLDLIDDLVHENSHHHLNLLLRKYRLLCGLHTEEIFYSPWRRSLRPLRGILHATFTFTMGAVLFERLSSFEARGARHAARGEKQARLTPDEVLRARFRCLEEIASVEYSLRDLDYAATKLTWLTAAGRSLVDSLGREIERIRNRIAPYEVAVRRSRHGPELKRHRQELAHARKTYGPHNYR